MLFAHWHTCLSVRWRRRCFKAWQCPHGRKIKFWLFDKRTEGRNYPKKCSMSVKLRSLGTSSKWLPKAVRWLHLHTEGVNTMQCNAMQYNTIQYNTIQYNAMRCNALQCNARQAKEIKARQCNAVQCNTMRCDMIQYNTIQYNAMQCNAIQYNTIQYNTIQYNTSLLSPWGNSFRRK